MKFQIVSDSSCDLPKERAQELGVDIVPFYVSFEEENYMKEGVDISVEDFYKKRYIKIWPYFALLCALDFVISPSKESLFEVFTNLTLCQGLLPNAKISVIGVSWTLAVIFVFYMLFPFCLLYTSPSPRDTR